MVAMSTIARSQNIDSTLAHYNRNYQPEKVWLHYDKDVYQAGETIWFKTYVMDGLFPAQQTKTVYIDWVGDNGEVLAHTVSPVIEGTSNGQLEIPENYTGNFIHVKSYTKWMLNFDSSFIYSKDIRILNKNTTSKNNSIAPVTTFEFFPEGGDAIEGISNRVAFKAADQWGLPVTVLGVIEDNKGTVIDSIHTMHDGMGSFVFTPAAGVTYSARWKDNKNTSHTTNLPAIKSSGASMQVTISSQKRYIVVQKSNTTEERFRQLHIIGTMNSGTAFKTDVNLSATNSARKVIPTEILPSGILTITLFDAAWNAIAERITFIDNGDYSFATSLEVKHWGLNKRAQNDIQLNIPAGLQGANLSVSITDAGIEKDTSSSIISHFMLTGDLKGYVHHPSYYFSSKEDSVVQNLDLVMLTHGWRRFKWEDITKAKLPVITQPRDTSYLSLSGKVYGVTRSQLTGKESIFLFVTAKDSATQTVFTPIHADGSFKDPDFIFFDTLKVYYQLKSKLFSNADAKFMIDRLSTPNYIAASKNFIKLPTTDTAGFYRHTLLAAELLRIKRIEKGKMMENITITAKSKPLLKQMDEKYTKGMFSGGDGYQFDLANDPMAIGQMNVFNYLQGKVAGLQINSAGSTPTLSWRGGSPQLYLDEMPIDAEFLNTIPVTDIAFVKVFRPPFMGGFNGSGGAIAVYTRKGDDIKSKPGGLNTNTIAGYTPIREFYSPNYSRFDKRNEQPDLRTTLYWNPIILVPANSTSVKLQFYNNDVSKAFRVVIEGISKEGLVTHHEEVIE